MLNNLRAALLVPDIRQRVMFVFFAFAVFVFAIWGFVEMYFLKGTGSTNQFGPDPLAGDAEAQYRRRGLGSHAPAWDQNGAIELAPHIGSPPPSMRVNRGT